MVVGAQNDIKCLFREFRHWVECVRNRDMGNVAIFLDIDTIGFYSLESIDPMSFFISSCYKVSMNVGQWPRSAGGLCCVPVCYNVWLLKCRCHV